MLLLSKCGKKRVSGQSGSSAIVAGEFTGVDSTFFGFAREDGIEQDLFNVCLENYPDEVGPNFVRQYVAVVKPDYFSYYGTPNTVGITFFDWCGSIIVDQAAATLAHEFGHNIGGLDDRYRNGSYVPPYVLSGYNYEDKIEIKPGEVPVGCPAGGYQDIMGPELFKAGVCNWVEEEAYHELFGGMLKHAGQQKEYFMMLKLDAQGNIAAGNQRSAFFSIESTGGEASSSEGTHTLNLVGMNGDALFSTKFNPGLLASKKNGQLEKLFTAEPQAALLKVPALNSGYLIKIRSPEGVISDLVPLEEEIFAAINRIPEGSYTSNPQQTRQALLSVVSSVRASYLQRDFVEVRNILENNLLPMINASVGDGPTSKRFEMNRSKLNNLVGQKLTFLNQLGGANESENAFIRISPMQGQFIPGQRAKFAVEVKQTPTSPDSAIGIKVWFRGENQKATIVNEKSWEVETPKLPAGISTLSVRAYLYSPKKEAVLKSSIRRTEVEIFRIDSKIRQETDPDIILELQKNKQKLTDRIMKLEEQIELGRKSLAQSVRWRIDAN